MKFRFLASLAIFSFSISGLISGCAGAKHQAISTPVKADTSGVNSVAKESKLPQGEIGSDRLNRVRPVVGTHGMVVSDDPIASEWGAEILRRGGNAVDAAVATAFMLSVTRPHYGSLGGGGFLVYCPAPKPAGTAPDCKTIDYREKAPAAASRDMYVKNGKANTDLSQDGAMASGVPGVTAGLLTALESWGSRNRAEILSKPIRMARGGFPRTGWMESAAKNRWDSLNEPAKELLGCRDKSGFHPCAVGTTIVQPDLTRVLEEISSRGIRGFYHGWVAEKIVDGIRKAGGVLTADDFLQYKATIRAPLEERVHLGTSELNVVTMPPPSSGGVLLLQMLGYMDRAERGGNLAEGFGSASSLHSEAHAMSLAFADRAQYLGDLDFVKVPLDSLLSQSYLNQRWSTFNPTRANPPAGASEVGKPEPQYTTHFSVVDAEGNAVAITTTINDEYGSGFVPPGTGIFMNDEMDDFSVQPGVPNMFGLIGGEANSIAAGKRPLSSMTPTIVRDDGGNVILVLGASGGPRIISAVFNVIVDHFEFGMGLSDAVAAARLHDQWRPNELRVEKFGFAPEVLNHLRAMGYTIAESPALAKIQAIAHFPNGRTWGVADPRGEGAAVAQ
jgi:gamma-glutamyltranspeptidase/glutathione hydrolase